MKAIEEEHHGPLGAKTESAELAEPGEDMFSWNVHMNWKHGCVYAVRMSSGDNTGL